MEDDTASVRALLEGEELMTPKYGISAAGVIIADNDTANTVVEAYIQYYDLYLKYLGKTLTPEDSLSVSSLANLCAQEYGYAVYLSRTLHNLLYDDMQMFDSECDTVEEEESRYQGGNIQQPPSLATASSNGQQYRLMPNPNSGNFGLRQSLADNRPVQIEVYSALGALIYRQDIEFINKKADISLGDISTGNYLLKLRDSTGNIFTIKFTVLK